MIGNEVARCVTLDLAYFVILATGLFDDLAWLANHTYALRLKKEHVDLRKKEFKQALESKNQELKQYLDQSETANRIALFYPLRDQVQHRMFLQAKHVVNRKLGRDENWFELPAGTFKHIRNLEGIKGCQKWGVHSRKSTHFIEARRFTGCALAKVAEIHNHFLERIDWVGFLDRLPAPLKKEVTAQIECFGVGVWRFLDFPRKPLYL